MTAPLSYSLITGKEIMFEKSLFLTCEILGLLVNTLATNENYHVLNRVNLTIPIQMQLPQKQKYFSEFSVKYLKSRLNFEHFKENMTLTAFVFPKLWILKTWLDKCLKSPVPENPLPRTIVNVRKHCWNLHHSNFIIFIHHCQGNWVGKGPSYWHVKSWHCLLTHWLPMKSILLMIGTI